MGRIDIEVAKKIANEAAEFRATEGSNIISLSEESGKPSPENALVMKEITEAFNIARKKKSELYESREMAGVDFIKAPYFARGNTTVVFGESGSAKSLMCIGLTGLWTNEGAKVLYINTEDNPSTAFIPRIKANEVKDENFRAVCGQWVFNDTGLLQLIVEFRPDVIIWDMLKDMAGNNMDLVMNPGDIRRVLTYLNIVAEKLNACCVVIHHSNKSGGQKSVNRVQGSMDWFGKARSVLEVAYDKNSAKYNVFHVKANHTRKAQGYAFSIRDKNLGLGINGIEVTAPEVLWDSIMSMTEEDLQPEGNQQSRMERAANLIIETLKNSSHETSVAKYMASKELAKLVTEKGVPIGTYETVKKDLSKKKIILSKQESDGWYTYLPNS